MESDWTSFYLTTGGAAAALTGLLFVAVALRPREIRDSPMKAGRARAAFYAFVSVLFASLLALAGTSSKLIGLAQIGVAVGVLALPSPFTMRALRSGESTSAVRSCTTPGSSSSAWPVRSAPSRDPPDMYDVLLATGSLLPSASHSATGGLTQEG